MPTFRVTEEKLKEHFGRLTDHALHPLKSWEFRFIAGWLLLSEVGVVGLSLVLRSREPQAAFWVITILTLVFAGSLIGWYFAARESLKMQFVSGMKDLVNDRELLWLNAKGPYDTVTKWYRANKGGIPETTFKILAYLKKHGTGQGMHRTIKSQENSGSANRTLQRLSEKVVFGEPIVRREGSDYKYVPWQFKIVDRNNKAVATPEAAKMEKLLAQCWEKMIEGEAR